MGRRRKLEDSLNRIFDPLCMYLELIKFLTLQFEANPTDAKLAQRIIRLRKRATRETGWPFSYD